MVEDVTEEEDLLETEEELQEDESIIELFPVTQLHTNIHDQSIHITSPGHDTTMNNTGNNKRKAGRTEADIIEDETCLETQIRHHDDETILTQDKENQTATQIP